MKTLKKSRSATAINARIKTANIVSANFMIFQPTTRAKMTSNAKNHNGMEKPSKVMSKEIKEENLKIILKPLHNRTKQIFLAGFKNIVRP